MAKFGEQFFSEMVDRGRRELGGVLFNDSNVAQPMYPLRGGYAVTRETGAVGESPTLAERLQEPAVEQIEPDRDERDRELDRE